MSCDSNGTRSSPICGPPARHQFFAKDTTFTKIFVGGLPYHTTDESLRQYFERYGEIEEAVVITDRQTGKSRGYGFVTMVRKESAILAIREPNPCIDGRKANVNLAVLGAKPRSIAGVNNATNLLAMANGDPGFGQPQAVAAAILGQQAQLNQNLLQGFNAVNPAMPRNMFPAPNVPVSQGVHAGANLFAAPPPPIHPDAFQRQQLPLLNPQLMGAAANPFALPQLMYPNNPWFDGNQQLAFGAPGAAGVPVSNPLAMQGLNAFAAGFPDANGGAAFASQQQNAAALMAGEMLTKNGTAGIWAPTATAFQYQANGTTLAQAAGNSGAANNNGNGAAPPPAVPQANAAVAGVTASLEGARANGANAANNGAGQSGQLQKAFM